MEVLAVCHVHSKWSYDGSWTLEALSAKFTRRGCRVLMMTEHDHGFSEARLKQYRTACAQTSTDKILVVPGIEYSDAANRTHVLVWGNVPFLGEGLPTGEMLNAVKAADGLAILAHPSRRDAWQLFESSWSNLLLGIEVWNRKYDGWAPSKTAPTLLKMADAVPFVGLDFHTQRQSFPLTMALNVDGVVTEETVVESLRARRCYPRALGWPLQGGLIHKASPVFSLAEKGRRLAASVIRCSRTSARRRAPAKNS